MNEMKTNGHQNNDPKKKTFKQTGAIIYYDIKL